MIGYKMAVDTETYDAHTGGTNPRMEELFSKVGRIATTVRNGNDVEVWLNVPLNQEDIRKLLDRARVMRRKGDDGRAEILLRLLVSAEPKHAGINFQLGCDLFNPFPVSTAIPYLQVAASSGTERQRVIAATYLAILHLMNLDRPSAEGELRSAGVGGQKHLEWLLEAVEGLRDLDYEGAMFDDGEWMPVSRMVTATILYLAGDAFAAMACLGGGLKHGREARDYGRWDAMLQMFNVLSGDRLARTRVGYDRASGLLKLWLVAA